MNSPEPQKGTSLVDPSINPDEAAEAVLRPLEFSDFTGQKKTKELQVVWYELQKH